MQTLDEKIIVYVENELTISDLHIKALSELAAFGATSIVPEVTAGLLLDGFLQNKFARVTTGLADAANGIGDVFARAFHAKDEICIGDTCVTETQLKALLAAQNEAQTASAAGT